MNLPSQYKFLSSEKGLKPLSEFLRIYGTQEFVGEANNPEILKWAKELRDHVGIEYKADSTPWCGLGMGIVTLRAGFIPPFLCIRAKEWLKFGVPKKFAELSDVLVFDRKGGGHVGEYVGEDRFCYHVLGANQNPPPGTVSFTRIEKSRLLGIRGFPYKTKPQNIRRIILGSSGIKSENEV